MSKPIPDYTESQVWTVAESLKQRFRKEIEIREIRLSPHDRELALVPGLDWAADPDRGRKQKPETAE